MIAHSFNRFYVVNKFILPTVNDINFSKLNFDGDCEYLRKRDKVHNHSIEQCIFDLIVYCGKIKPYLFFYKQQIKSLNDIAHDILKNEIDIILPKLPENRKGKGSIFAMLISGFIGLTYEGISSFLHNRRHKAVKVIDKQATIQHNKPMHSEDSMVMYGVYNAETLENLIHTVHHMHNSTMEIEKLFAGQLNSAYMWYSNAPGTQHYAIDSILYLRTIRDKYIQMYKKFITQPCIQHKGNHNFGKWLSTYLAYHANKIKRNFRHSENYYTQNKSRL